MNLSVMREKFLFYCLCFFWIFCSSCVEEIDMLSAEDFNSILIVESTITDELKQQHVILSRAFELDSLGPVPESNASVLVRTDSGERYLFNESEPGLYSSVDMFSGQPNINYQLSITTQSGRNYLSSSESLMGSTHIDELYIERDFNENNLEGVSVYIDTNDELQDSNYYRFEYEETYKIIAPLYSPLELIINNDDFPYPASHLAGMTTDEIVEYFVIRDFRAEQEQICYNTVKSNSILVASTTNLAEDKLNKFRIRFIGRDNYTIQYRYSILVKQFVQSYRAHTFYSTLHNFSTAENLLSEIQTGFIAGNIYSLTNDKEHVGGFFEIAATDSKRVYFNYEDLFPNEDLPPYYLPCDDYVLPALIARDPATGIITHSPIQDAIKKNQQYYDENLIDGNDPLSLVWSFPYYMVYPYCGDCTVLGQNITPDWWEE